MILHGSGNCVKTSLQLESNSDHSSDVRLSLFPLSRGWVFGALSPLCGRSSSAVRVHGEGPMEVPLLSLPEPASEQPPPAGELPPLAAPQVMPTPVFSVLADQLRQAEEAASGRSGRMAGQAGQAGKQIGKAASRGRKIRQAGRAGRASSRGRAGRQGRHSEQTSKTSRQGRDH